MTSISVETLMNFCVIGVVIFIVLTGIAWGEHNEDGTIKKRKWK